MRETGNWMKEVKINCPPLDYEHLEISAGQEKKKKKKNHQRGKEGSFSIHPANIPTFAQIFLNFRVTILDLMSEF